jgi:two-component system cell cycle sensor histidine kinase/response regulator CckA
VIGRRPAEGLDNQPSRLTLVLENAPVIMFGLDDEGRFTFSEGNGLSAMGLRAGQTMGVSALELYGDNPAAREAIGGALAGKQTSFESFFSGAHFITRLTPVRDDAGVVEEVVGVSVDTGRQVEAEEALRERETQLRQSQKMEAVGRLAGGIAHDFNNLLTAIIGYSDLLLASEGCSLESVKGDVQEIRRAAYRAAGLTRQILAFSRRQALRPEVTSMNDLLKDAEALLRQTLGEEIALDLVLEPDLGLVEVDRSQLVQAIVNLVVNARDAMPSGGKLSLQTANVDIDEGFHGVAPEITSGSYVALIVSDTGVGMDENTLLHVFEPFFTTKGPGEGPGLGLSTVYGIVRQSGGDILVESEPGRGTTFRVYLPRSSRLPGDAARVVAPSTVAAAHEVILVVEDDAAVRSLVTRVLANEDYIVLEAHDAAQALALLDDVDCPVDLLLSDLVLPSGLQGDVLAQKALASRERLPVLLMSGYPRQFVDGERRLDAGFNYLQKPFTPESLTRKVREALDAGRRYSTKPSIT